LDNLWQNSVMEGSPTVSQLLNAWGRGDAAALDQLTPQVYGELRKLARAYLRRGQPAQSLQPTALINEVFLRPARSSPSGRIGHISSALPPG
jgi:hypothetical protein